MRRLRADERGANAIEYGLIAGFLGVGILVALLGTKTSLNQTYTAIAGGVGGGSGAAASVAMPTSSIARSSFWSNRTLVDGYPVKSGTASAPKTTYLFTDGFTADFTPRNDGYYFFNYTDPTNNTKYVSYIAPDGSTYYGAYTYTDATMTALSETRWQSSSTRGPAGNPSTISTMMVSTYNAAGATTSTTYPSPSGFDSNQATNMYLYDKYFQSIN